MQLVCRLIIRKSWLQQVSLYELGYKCQCKTGFLTIPYEKFKEIKKMCLQLLIKISAVHNLIQKLLGK